MNTEQIPKQGNPDADSVTWRRRLLFSVRRAIRSVTEKSGGVVVMACLQRKPGATVPCLSPLFSRPENRRKVALDLKAAQIAENKAKREAAAVKAAAIAEARAAKAAKKAAKENAKAVAKPNPAAPAPVAERIKALAEASTMIRNGV